MTLNKKFPLTFNVFCGTMRFMKTQTSKTLTGCPYEIFETFKDFSSFFALPDGRRINCIVIHDHGKYQEEINGGIPFRNKPKQKTGNYVDRIGLNEPLKELTFDDDIRKALKNGESFYIYWHELLFVYLQANVKKTKKVETYKDRGERWFFDVFKINLPVYQKSYPFGDLLGSNLDIEEGKSEYFIWLSYNHSEKIQENKTMDLSNIALEDLEEEINRRKRLQSLAPKVLDKINWEPVIDICESYVKNVRKEVQELGYYCDDDDYGHYIYETVLKAVFGNEFFNWFNRQLD